MKTTSITVPMLRGVQSCKSDPKNKPGSDPNGKINRIQPSYKSKQLKNIDKFELFLLYYTLIDKYQKKNSTFYGF